MSQIFFGNPGFESGGDGVGWQFDADYTRSNLDAHEGTWSINQVSTTGFANLYTINNGLGIIVPANSNFILSFWLKVVSVTGSLAKLQVNHDSAFGVSYLDVVTVGTVGAWQQFSVRFNSGNFTNIWIRIYNNNGALTAYYDQFELELVSQPKNLSLLGVG